MPILRTDNPRRPADFYESPYGLVQAALKLLPIKSAPLVLDPGAGKGRWGKMLRKDGRFAKTHLTGIDPYQEESSIYNKWIMQDYLKTFPPVYFDLIMGNVPYSLDEEFVRHSWGFLKPGGWMIFLLRLAFLEGQKRCENFWPHYMPEYVYTLGRRPSFTEDGHTDATAYALYLWRKPRWSWEHMPTEYRGCFLNWDYLPEDLTKRKAKHGKA